MHFLIKSWVWRLVLTCVVVAGMHFNCPGRTSGNGKPDTSELFRRYYQALRVSDPDSALQLFHQTLVDGEAEKCDEIIEGSLLKMGEKYLNKGDWQQALSYTSRAVHYTHSFAELCNCYSYLGYIYYVMGDYVTASGHFYTALKYIKQEPMAVPNESAVYRFLGMINSRLHQEDKALHFYDLSEAVARRFPKHKNYVVLALLCKGELFMNSHKADSAERLYVAATQLADSLGRKDLKSEAIAGLGKTFLEAGAYEKAVYYLRVALQGSEGRDKELAIDVALHLGEALCKLKRYKEAEGVLLGALEQAKATRFNAVAVTGYGDLVNICKATGRYAEAIAYMDSMAVLKDSVVNADKIKAINVMDIKYQTAEKDKQIAQQATKIAHKNMWILGIGAGIVILLLISAGAFVHILNRQRTLERENKIGMLNAAILGGDTERGRIARELHDGVGGMLSAAMLHFSSLHREDGAIATTPAYRDVLNILREMGDEIRKTAHNLMPEVLLRQSLPDALGTYCNSITGKHGLEVDFQSYGTYGDVPDEYKLNLYRMVQELLKNIVQHAKASTAVVQLLRNGSILILSVEDNGIGFDMEHTNSGQGISNMETRVGNLDGKFTLGSVPGKGTSVFIEINIPGSPSNDQLSNSA